MDTTDKIVGQSRLLRRVRDLIRRKHYSIRTEQAYLSWIKRFILFHDKQPHCQYPNASREGGWQYVFFAKNRAIDLRSGFVASCSVENPELAWQNRGYLSVPNTTIRSSFELI